MTTKISRPVALLALAALVVAGLVLLRAPGRQAPQEDHMSGPLESDPDKRVPETRKPSTAAPAAAPPVAAASAADAPRATAGDYVEAIRKTVDACERLTAEQKKDVLARASAVVAKLFDLPGTQNAAQPKLAAFKEHLPDAVSLARMGLPVPAETLAEDQRNIAAFYAAQMEYRLTLFLARRPPSPAKVREREEHLAALAAQYKAYVDKRFPDYVMICGDDHVLDQIRQLNAAASLGCGASVLFKRTTLAVDEDALKRHLSGKLPDVKLTWPHLGDDILAQLRKPDLSKNLREGFKHHYTLVMDNQLKRLVRELHHDLRFADRDKRHQAVAPTLAIPLSELRTIVARRNAAMAPLWRLGRRRPRVREK